MDKPEKITKDMEKINSLVFAQLKTYNISLEIKGKDFEVIWL